MHMGQGQIFYEIKTWAKQNPITNVHHLFQGMDGTEKGPGTQGLKDLSNQS